MRHLAVTLNPTETHDGRECAPWRNPRKANSWKRIEEKDGSFKREAGNHCRIGFINDLMR